MFQAVTLREAVLTASNLGIEKVIFELDSLLLIRACKNEIQLGEVQHLVKDIVTLHSLEGEQNPTGASIGWEETRTTMHTSWPS